MYSFCVDYSQQSGPQAQILCATKKEAEQRFNGMPVMEDGRAVLLQGAFRRHSSGFVESWGKIFLLDTRDGGVEAMEWEVEEGIQ